MEIWEWVVTWYDNYMLTIAGKCWVGPGVVVLLFSLYGIHFDIVAFRT